ncbi:MAG TPA: EF-hand domain-containing protein [Sulfurovum sp.]|jgi:Ca2+-binding EF-hand superfamily protein|nr:MAG: hypothetical protein B7Y63_06995 [Sulfurovum sp. 35-42-20]OYZ26171.1 MAG: hypothetical protein B7Y23_02995 [Sulfurovum sp. 16-42-52]OYZ47747.1 MAG: hypothetical protein B7Y13_09460 [Sulfurovum sp. 24-42-9]OZA46209.1 MAG: hypothetical protein B7X80_03425 [Sulfurovum sp. 17-42-90]OZA60751.1 MAG: hypothetical protein B7X69_02660 [Sulfurovum sp. 39-42-12]HQR74522.1 EF-hand domain-containing protein [Sulfurovum sp.]
MKKMIFMALFASLAWSADVSQAVGQGMGQGKGMQLNCMKNQPTFAQFDINKDGKITASELEEARAKQMAQKTQEGKMLKNAYKAPAFADMDINKDGNVDEKEFASHQAERVKACQSTKGNTMCPCQCKTKGKMNQNKGMNMVTFEEIDTNKDGSLSKEEFSAHQAQRMKQCQKCQPNSAKCNAK